MENGLFYSEEALLNRVLFLSDYNEVIFFVEDEFKEFLYEELINRLFSYQLKIGEIFPMNGKKGVEKAFQEYGDNYENKPAVYIVDADFDVIMENDMVQHENYIYLEKYNIESYFLDKRATIKFMARKLKKRQKEVKGIINYSEWETDTYNQLKELFINYVIVKRTKPNEKNVGLSPYCYIDINGCVNHQKIKAYAENLSKSILDYEELYEFYIKKFEELLGGDPSRLVCGKYMLSNLSQYLRKKTNVNFKEEDFINFLSGEFDIRKLDFIKQRILKILDKMDVA